MSHSLVPFLLLMLLGSSFANAEETLRPNLRSRVKDGGEFKEVERKAEWDPKKTGADHL
jgi:hypothetical protein